jgi:signal peptide peptidase SppA
MLVKYSRILRAVYSSIWAIHPEKLDQIVAFLEFAAMGGKYSAEEVSERIGARMESAQNSQARASNIAIIPIRGIIAPRVSQMDSISGPGGTSTEQISRNLRQALADETVKAIVFDVDSPGGSVYGVDELAAEIFKARGRKPMVSQVNPVSASAAYYLASAADEMVLTPSGEAGSIGVIVRHVDESKAAEMEGVKVTYIHAGDFKAEGNPFEPLGEEAKAYLQKRVDEYYGMFVKAVAKGRGLSVAKVKSDFGQGRMLGAEDALKVGMVDRIGTMEDTVSRLAGRKGATVVSLAARAEESVPEIVAEIPSESIAAEDPNPESGSALTLKRQRERQRLELI